MSAALNILVRPATDGDVDAIYKMIVGLAVYEKEPEAVTGSAQMLRAALFGETIHAEALVAEAEGTVVGFALFHGTFSTWHCLPGIWLEDFYVQPAYRRGGVGEQLFRAVAALAVARGCSRMAWSALDWNETALNFYAKMGAEVLGEWTTRRLSGAALQDIAAGR